MLDRSQSPRTSDWVTWSVNDLTVTTLSRKYAFGSAPHLDQSLIQITSISRYAKAEQPIRLTTMKLNRKTVLTALSSLLLTCGLAVTAGCKKSEAPPDGKSRLHIVALAPLTGPDASLGEYFRNGIELAQEQAASRYPDKIEIKVELLDSKSQPQEGLKALQTALVQKRPDVIISAMSSVSKAIAPIAEQEDILTIATTTALTDLTKSTKTILRVYPTSDDFIRPVATHMGKTFDRIAILYSHDDFGDSNQRLFGEIIKSAGKQITASEPFELAAADSRTVIARLLATSPQAVFVTGHGPAYAAVFRQLKESKTDLPVYTEIEFANPSILSALGKDADGIIFDGTEMELTDPQDPEIASFQKQYRSRFGKEPFHVAGFAHDSIMILADAAMMSGAFAKPKKRSIIAGAPFQVMMGTIQFDAEGECRVPLKIMKREAGRTVLLPQ
jgi:branched-chain amino acid transport system substrate-binding protein